MDKQRYTFWQLISQKRIVIPIIQRDYAQGRENAAYVRKGILTQIGKALGVLGDGIDPTACEFDFVYGTETRRVGADNTEVVVMQPLDGQQRLTTIWLIHWYVALRAMRLSDKHVKNTLKNFSYETRSSSREFCEKLCEIDPRDVNGEALVNYIENQFWFYSVWKHDPTIKAMLCMINGTKTTDGEGIDFIDGIEELFADTSDEKFEELWQLLTSDACPMAFNFIPLDSEELPRPDDLYIKMNARGKPLTNFENFKAELIGWVNKNSAKFPQNFATELAAQLDNQFTDIFWQNAAGIILELQRQNHADACNTEKQNVENSIDNVVKSIDKLFFTFINRFFHFISLMEKESESTSVWNSGTNNDKQFVVRDKNAGGSKYYNYFNPSSNKSDNKSDNDTNIVFESFEYYSYFLDKNPSLIVDLRNILLNYHEFIIAGGNTLPQCDWDNDFCFIPELHEIKGNKGCTYIVTTINLRQRPMFYAICKYFREGNADETSLRQWLRVVNNLIASFDYDGRDDVRSYEMVQAAITIINRLKPHDVYNSLLCDLQIGVDYTLSSNLEKRLHEEIIKARQILNAQDGGGPDENNIIEAENHKMLCGSIQCLYMNDNEAVDWSEFNAKFEKFKAKFEAIGNNYKIELLPYFTDEQIRDIFKKRKFDNNDKNLHYLLSNYPVQAGKWLMDRDKASDADSMLHKNLAALLAPDATVKIKEIENHSLWFHPSWEAGIDVLSTYKSRTAAYKNESIIVVQPTDSPLLKACERLHAEANNLPEGELTIDSPAGGNNVPAVGLYVSFTYKSHPYRYHTDNTLETLEPESAPDSDREFLTTLLISPTVTPP